MRRALQREGWIKVRQSGSHETWASADGARVVTVAVKDSDAVPVGTLAAIRRATGTARSPLKDYLIIYEQAEDGAWGAHSPDVDGVFALGQARREAESRMAEALTAHLAHLRASGRPIPDPHTDAGRIAA